MSAARAKSPKPTKPRSVPEPADDEAAAAELSLPDKGAVIQHPDGWYWLAERGSQQFGPFESAAEALADMHAAADDGLEPGETLEEAEDELGVAGWVDPDTGELAEDSNARIEDH